MFPAKQTTEGVCHLWRLGSRKPSVRIESNRKSGQQRCRFVKAREGLLGGICKRALYRHFKRTQVGGGNLKIGEELQPVGIIRVYGHGDIEEFPLRPFNEEREHVRKLAISYGRPQLRGAHCDVSPSATYMRQRHNLRPCPDQCKYPCQIVSRNLMYQSRRGQQLQDGEKRRHKYGLCGQQLYTT
jgi:hypothetical protein